MNRHPKLPKRRAVALLFTCVCLLSASLLGGCGNTSPSGSQPTAAGSREASEHTSTTLQDSSDWHDIDVGCDLGDAQPLDLSYARNFTIDTFEDGYRLVCISNGDRFLIVPEGAQVPQGLDEDIAIIEQQPSSVYLVSTGMICLLDELDTLDDVTVSSVTAEDSPNDHLTQALEEGSTVYGGKYSAPDFELIADKGCTLAIENTKINHAPDIKAKLEDLGCVVLTEQSSTEPEVLGRLEWIKLMGTIFGREDEAQKSFERLAARIDAASADEPLGKTAAFFYINEDGAAVTRRSTDYFSQMIEMAGGTFLSFDPADEDGGASSSVQAVIDLETFYADAHDADVIIYNTTVDASVTSLDDLVAKNPLLADFTAVKSGRVFACDENIYQAMTSADRIIGDLHAALEGHDGNAGFIWKLD
ncbi:ABC transporter substrate-binding protein [Collinsella tanakaei]|uniref:ABC transporter substrate-binding protein n=1 Tax=Collinsella tanakaei TaxID=626935 RepID=UPI0025A4551F|nr:ABC transporter substrate-binding protein [Collinsella tanakaei]MDM8300609.1 ABC transporter substrate-binding protein [Collinsella tanakaei]